MKAQVMGHAWSACWDSDNLWERPMQSKADIYRYDLRFKEPAMTSRGTYYTHTVWYVVFEHGNRMSIGECAPLPDLSSDFLSMGADLDERLFAYERKLKELFATVFKELLACKTNEELLSFTPDTSAFLNYPSMLFGLEGMLAHMRRQLVGGLHEGQADLMLWDTPFSRNEEGILINGLIWMGDFETMGQRIKNKIAEGFRCIKLKIGAIDFDRELELLSYIRERFSPEELELRVDANGAFSVEEAPAKLEQLSRFHLHSIEQPVKAGQYQQMAELCASSPIAVGLDEELIGVYERERKIELIDTIKPQYLIIKPSLHGGFAGTREWIELASERGIGYWLTSALESTIGLNALAQWCSTEELTMPQGLGTGALYTNNLNTPMYIKDARLFCNLSLPEMSNYRDYLHNLFASSAARIFTTEYSCSHSTD